jgi:tRNA-dihydrouridine synthase C
MEGVTDAPMRALLTSVGGFDLCVSEFLRISQQVPPPHTYQAHVPELATNLMTQAGCPILLQLLGGNPERMAQAAQVGVTLGSTGIDLNFGCPARTVNRHDGGAALLRAPDRIRTIVAAVRQSVPQAISVSVKLRLGWEDPQDIHATADAATEGGASWITIHGRTKVQGYRPPAYWEPIGEVRARLPIPVIANGDIWTLEDAARCLDVTGCQHLMLGRGAVADPHLAGGVARLLQSPAGNTVAARPHPSPHAWLALLQAFVVQASYPGQSPRHLPGRIKQWGKMVHGQRPDLWYPLIKTLKSTEEILERVALWASTGD